MPRLLLVHLYERYLLWLAHEVEQQRRRPATLEYYRRELAALVADLGQRHTDELVAFDLARHVRGWHSVQAAQRLLNWGVQMGLIGSNPWAKVAKPPTGQRQRVLTASEWDALLAASGKALRAFLAFQRHTLARPGEVRALTWADLVEEDGRAIAFRLRVFKARDRRRDGVAVRFLVLDQHAYDQVQQLRAQDLRGNPSSSSSSTSSRGSGGPVFTNSRGVAWTNNALRLAVRRACKRAGLDDDGERVVAYTIRHTGATAATRNGVRDRTLADLMGHTSTRTTSRYQHLDTSDLRAAITQATKGA